MDRIKRLLKKLLFLPIRIILLTDIVAMPFVIVALNRLKPTDPAALAAYFLSAYALAVTAVNFKRIVRRIKQLFKDDELAAVRGIKRLMRKNKYTKLYLESKDFRAVAALYFGLAINLLYAVFKFVTGAVNRSLWLWSIGFYYMFLGMIRFFLMRGVRRQRSTENAEETRLHDYKTYRLCGVLMMILDLAIGGMAVQMIRENTADDFSKAAMIISAAFTFYCFILSIYNATVFRKRDNAVLSAAKYLALTGALMSMFSLQTMMIHVFGEKESDSFRKTMNTATGSVVIAAVIAIAAYMIIDGTKKINMSGELER